MTMSLCNTNEYDLIACVCVDYIYYCRTHTHSYKAIPTILGFYVLIGISGRYRRRAGGCDDPLPFFLLY